MDSSPESGSALQLGVALLFIVHEARRFERILHACHGDIDAARRVYAQVQRAEGWREAEAA